MMIIKNFNLCLIILTEEIRFPKLWKQKDISLHSAEKKIKFPTDIELNQASNRINYCHQNGLGIFPVSFNKKSEVILVDFQVQKIQGTISEFTFLCFEQYCRHFQRITSVIIPFREKKDGVPRENMI